MDNRAMAGTMTGAPMLVRNQDGVLNLANFMQTQIYSAIATIAFGTDILEKEGYEPQALSVLEYAVSVGSDISNTYTLCAKIYQKNEQWDKIEWLKNEAEIISTSRKDSIVRKLQEFGPYNG